jgi:putative ABC transport system substrate-binding protein
MRRRDFIILVGGTAAAWPLAARAQPERVRLIGVLSVFAKDDPEAMAREAAFQQTLADFGWTIGRNVRIDYRRSGGDTDSLRKYAAELVALAPGVIMTHGSQAIGPVLQQTRTVPIVFVSVDPVGSRHVASLARPGGNATGFTQFEYRIAGKWLEVLHEIAPSISQVAVIRDPRTGPGIAQFAVIQALAPCRFGTLPCERCQRRRD